MSVKRSPTGCGSGAKPAGSQSKSATNPMPIYDTPPQITQRLKRKEPDDDAWIKSEFSDIKKQISELMAVLKLNSDSHSEKIDRLSEDITTIKNQVKGIGVTIENIILDQNNIKTRLEELDDTTLNIENKIELLESDLHKFKSEQPMNYEEMFNEINQRNIRSKNIVIVGIPEPDTALDRQTYNNKEAEKITNAIYKECPKPIKVFRLGKYRNDRSRPLKVCFETEEPVKNILQNKNSTKLDHIKIYSDQTPQQRKHFQNLKEELKHRITNGESNLIIMYVKGTPKIIAVADETRERTVPASKN